MNCKNIEQQILLSQSGELSGREVEKLQRHLDSCESCRKFSEKAGEVMTLARNSLPAEGPSPVVMARILAAAREEANRKVIFFQLPSVRWAVYAAAAAVVICGVGLWILKDSPISSASQVSAIVMAVGSEENLNVIGQSGKTEKDQELQTLASHLLLMEGFVTDELQEVEIIDAADEPLPTALRLHNIDAFVLQRCV